MYADVAELGEPPLPPLGNFFSTQQRAAGFLSRNRCERQYNSFLRWQRRPGASLSWALGGGRIQAGCAGVGGGWEEVMDGRMGRWVVG